MKGAVYEKQVNAMGRSLKIDITGLIKPAAFIFFGAACSCFDAIEGVSPFTAAAVAAVDPQYCFTTFLGACAGYLAGGRLTQALKYFCVLALIMGVRLLYRRFPLKLNENALCCAACAVLSALGSGVYIAISGFTVSGAISGACEALTAGGACYFFRRSFSVPAFKIGLGRLHKQDSAFVCISACVTLLCLCGINIGLVRPAHLLACFIILTASHYRGCAGGALTGICAGASLCLTPGGGCLFAVMSLGGFAAGLLSGFGQFGCAVAFTAACGAVTLFEQGGRESLCILLEAACVCAAFAAMPHSALIRLENYLDKSGFASAAQTDREAAYSLRRAARTVAEVSDIVSRVSSGMDNIIDPQMSRIYARIQQSVCRTCSKKSGCWGEGFEQTTKEISKIADGNQTGESRCIRADELASAIKRNRKAYAAFFDTKLELDEVRAVVADQFGCMSALLDDLAERTASGRSFDYSKSVMIKQSLRQADIQLENAAYTVGSNGRARVEISMYADATDIDHELMRTLVSDAVMTEFDSPEIAVADLLVTLTFLQSRAFDINMGFSRLPANESQICGDSVECFEDYDENAVAVISDGMGTGARAAIDGTMAATLMKKLTMSGFSYDNALRLVNSALLVKSSDESLATVDAVRINPYTGSACFYKAGAAASYIRSSAYVDCISRASLPAGILRNVGFAYEERMLESSDIVLMVSDGVSGGEWISDELLTWSTADMSSLASHIADLARLKADSTQRDDISVAAIRIVKSTL